LGVDAQAMVTLWNEFASVFLRRSMERGQGAAWASQLAPMEKRSNRLLANHFKAEATFSNQKTQPIAIRLSSTSKITEPTSDVAHHKSRRFISIRTYQVRTVKKLKNS
jgi:hypothetical protein